MDESNEWTTVSKNRQRMTCRNNSNSDSLRAIIMPTKNSFHPLDNLQEEESSEVMDTLHRADKVNSVMKPNAQPFENNKKVTLNRLQVNLYNKDGHRTVTTSHLMYPPKQRLEGIYCTNNSAIIVNGTVTTSVSSVSKKVLVVIVVKNMSVDPVIKMLHDVKLNNNKYR
jgi:hypothetical protein